MEQIIQNPWLISLVLAWVLPWKGYALWLAASKKQKTWFVALLVVNTLAVLEILYIFVFSKMAEKKDEPIDNQDGQTKL